MSTRILVMSPGETREIDRAEFPVSVGGVGADLTVSGVDAGPWVHLGIEGDEFFVQPADEGREVLCNGGVLTASRWSAPRGFRLVPAVFESAGTVTAPRSKSSSPARTNRPNHQFPLNVSDRHEWKGVLSRSLRFNSHPEVVPAERPVADA